MAENAWNGSATRFGGMSPALAETTDSLSFFFDPACPWTWLTSRWFVDATTRRGTDVRWRAFSLTLINEGQDVPEEYRTPMLQSNRALRVIESLYAEGRHVEAGKFYAAIGERTFGEGQDFTPELVAAAGEAVGLDDVVERADSAENEVLVREAFAEIRPVVGDDVGSPAIRMDSTGKALFGPIVNPVPSAADGDRLLSATLTLLEIPTFFELKRTRTSGPDFS